MPDEAEFEAACDVIVRAVEAGKDGIAVPSELLVEADAEAGATEKVIPQSMFAQIQGMGVHERIKLAMRGNKDARTILMRDPIRLVRRCVLQNPRITDGEVIAVARNRSADEELLRMINEKREWVRNYQVRHALSTNPKTPLPVALRHVGTLSERDMRFVAKSKNVPQAVAVQARRILTASGKDV
jgi:hypothetical protein